MASSPKRLPVAKREDPPLVKPAGPAGGRAVGKAKPSATPVLEKTRWRMPAAKWAEQAMLLKPPASMDKRRKVFFSKIGIFIALPTLLMVFYVYVYATPRYVSELQITYQSNDPSATSASTGLISSIMGSSGGTVDMSQVLQTYLMSAAVAQEMDKQLGFRKHYSDSKIDWLDRLSTTASDEKYLIYFNKRVTVTRQLGGFVTVDVEAFSQKFAQAVAAALAKSADGMVAVMMDHVHNDAVKLAESQLKLTEDRLKIAMIQLTDFRNRHSDVNIQGTANSLDTVVSGLEAQLSTAKSDLADSKTFLSDQAPSVVALNARISALGDQISNERKRLGYSDPNAKSTTGKLPYSQIVSEFTSLQIEEKFASDSYVSAKKALDAARALAAQKAGYVVTFVPPDLPQASTSPDPTTYILSAFLVSCFVYMLGNLLIGVFRDKAGA